MQPYLKKADVRQLFPADRAVSILYPHRCPVCDGVISYAEWKGSAGQIGCHPKCLSRLHLIREPFCARCGKELAEEEQEYCADCRKRRLHFHHNIAVVAYSEAAQRSVARFKYSGRQEYAAFYAALTVRERGRDILRLHADALIPVPIHRSRLRARGYNQAELYARCLSRLLGIPVRADILLRVRRTRAQKQLSPPERIRNMQSALSVRGSLNNVRRVILTDDIYTTGSTLEACTRALAEAGVETVYCLTFCVGAGTE